MTDAHHDAYANKYDEWNRKCENICKECLKGFKNYKDCEHFNNAVWCWNSRNVFGETKIIEKQFCDEESENLLKLFSEKICEFCNYKVCCEYVGTKRVVFCPRSEDPFGGNFKLIGGKWMKQSNGE